MTLLHEMIDVHWGLGGANYLDYSFNTISICLIIFNNGEKEKISPKQPNLNLL